jgi:hypothetical protein
VLFDCITVRFLDGSFAGMRLLSALLTPKGREMFRGWLGYEVRTDVRDVFHLSDLTLDCVKKLEKTVGELEDVHISLTVASDVQAMAHLIDTPLPTGGTHPDDEEEEEEEEQVERQLVAEVIADPHAERVANGTLTAISLEERAERLRDPDLIKRKAIAQLRDFCSNWNTALEALDDPFRVNIKTVEMVFETWLTGTPTVGIVNAIKLEALGEVWACLGAE